MCRENRYSDQPKKDQTPSSLQFQAPFLLSDTIQALLAMTSNISTKLLTSATNSGTSPPSSSPGTGWIPPSSRYSCCTRKSEETASECHICSLTQLLSSTAQLTHHFQVCGHTQRRIFHRRKCARPPRPSLPRRDRPASGGKLSLSVPPERRKSKAYLYLVCR